MVILPEGPRAMDAAARALINGEVVALPTDTVYGLAVDAFQPAATARLFRAKRRPHDVDLPVLIADPDDVHRLAAHVSAQAAALIEAWWPGPLTIVLARRPGLAVDLGHRTDTVGLRCPDSEIVRELARRVGPLATSSANVHGEPTPRSALELAKVFDDGDVAVIVDGGDRDGAASTVVDATGDELRVLRQGGVVVPGTLG